MRRGTRRLVTGATVAALGVAGTIAAHAEWTIPVTGTVTARAASMPDGVRPSVAKRSRTAVVSWSAQEVGPGAPMDRYVVVGHSTDNPPLPGLRRTVVASGGATESVTFAADEVAGGRWRWTVTPHFARWAGAPGARSEQLAFPAARAATPPVEAAAPAPADTVSPLARAEPARPEQARPEQTRPAATRAAAPEDGPEPAATGTATVTEEATTGATPSSVTAPAGSAATVSASPGIPE